MRYFLKLAYNGGPFHGWQIQPNALSVQETLETALSTILRSPISVVGAGRTDTGVNAKEMFAHFDTVNEIADKSKFLASLNSLVGPYIALQDLIPVEPDAHARFDASERTYKYFVAFSKNPFMKDISWHCSSSLDIEAMNKAAGSLIGRRDFTSFAKLHSDAKTNICDVRSAEWEFLGNNHEGYDFIGNLNNGIVFTIKADRFLRNMVRAIVGTLIDVGRGKISQEQFENVLLAKNRGAAGTSMPPQALFLWHISYPFIKS